MAQNPTSLATLVVEKSPSFDDPRRWDWDVVVRMHRLADQDWKTPVCAYFIGGESGPIKIGYSVDPATRLRDLRSCSPVPLGLLAIAPGGRLREEAYHAQFAHRRLHGEWFEPCEEIISEIMQLRSEVPPRKGIILAAIVRPAPEEARAMCPPRDEGEGA